MQWCLQLKNLNSRDAHIPGWHAMVSEDTMITDFTPIRRGEIRNTSSGLRTDRYVFHDRGVDDYFRKTPEARRSWSATLYRPHILGEVHERFEEYFENPLHSEVRIF